MSALMLCEHIYFISRLVWRQQLPQFCSSVVSICFNLGRSCSLLQDAFGIPCSLMALIPNRFKNLKVTLSVMNRFVTTGKLACGSSKKLLSRAAICRQVTKSRVVAKAEFCRKLSVIHVTCYHKVIHDRFRCFF